MRRWNGWGDDTNDYPLPESAAPLLAEWVGDGRAPQDITLAEAVTAVPTSRLPTHPLVQTDAEVRLRHARGQSLPDLIALRSGQIGIFPDGVATPSSEDEVQTLIRFAQETGAQLIPYGGGTSVVGHINPLPGDAPALTVNLQRLNQLQQLDETSQLATFGAGVQGPDLEARLRAHGYTLGHFPQSFELSTLGGWIATRSSGQQSLGYGRIENLFAGGRLLSPAGRLELPPFPASAAGPDLRQVVLGSEGRLGIITSATVRITPLPEREEFHAVFFPDFAQGLAAARQLVQTGLPLSMLRLSTAVETATTLALAGHERLIGAVEKWLTWRGADDEKCMLMVGFTGADRMVKASRKAALDITGAHKGVHMGQQFGKQWHKGRFRTPYLRNTLWEMGYAVDTLETAVSWQHVPQLMTDIESAIRAAAAQFDERVHVFTHLSHLYTDGASIYTTYLFRVGETPDDTMQQWQAMKTAASQAIVAGQGTISHQHGVGLDHAPYLAAEKGELGMTVLSDLAHRFDPQGIMNPGKLIM
ncbi:MAG TPA: FAD-binding oxidoreductase [Chloroflexota bacterium]|nr:FAD-binding oxidoreductase [Chloroflexota bacterium]